MSRNLLNAKEIHFIRWGQRWNGKFQSLFAFLFVFTVVLPAALLLITKLPELQAAFEDARFYAFAVTLGWLISFLNERWVRIVNKVVQLETYHVDVPKVVVVPKVLSQRNKSMV